MRYSRGIHSSIRELKSTLSTPSLVSKHALASIDHAIRGVKTERPWLTTSLLTAAVRTLGATGHASLIPEVLDRIPSQGDAGNPLPGRQRVYNEAVRAVALEHTVNASRLHRALELVERMRVDKVEPSSYTLKQVFEAARRDANHQPDDLLRILTNQLQHGIRVRRDAFDALLEACATASRSCRTEESPYMDCNASTRASSHSNRLPILLVKVLSACQLTPSGHTLGCLLTLVHSEVALKAVHPLVAMLPAQTRREVHKGALTQARIRVDPDGVAQEMLDALRKRCKLPLGSHLANAYGGDRNDRRFDERHSDADTTRLEYSSSPAVLSDASRRALLLTYAASSNYSGCMTLLDHLWKCGFRVDDKVCWRLLHSAGEGASQGNPDAFRLLSAVSAAMFGHGPAARIQRTGARRSATAEHEATRTLMRAEWRAGIRRAADAKTHALARLTKVGVKPRPRLLASCIYWHAAEGDYSAALKLLESPPPAFYSESIIDEDDKGLPSATPALVAQTDSESCYLALLGGVRNPHEVEHAIAALQLMVIAGIRPSLRTRIALARMAVRLQLWQTAGAERPPIIDSPLPRLPGGARFWGVEAYRRPTNAASKALPIENWLAAMRREVDIADEPGHVAAPPPKVGSTTCTLQPQVPHESIVSAAADLILESRMAAHLERMCEIIDGSSELVTRELTREARRIEHERRQRTGIGVKS